MSLAETDPDLKPEQQVVTLTTNWLTAFLL